MRYKVKTARSAGADPHTAASRCPTSRKLQPDPGKGDDLPNIGGVGIQCSTCRAALRWIDPRRRDQMVRHRRRQLIVNGIPGLPLSTGASAFDRPAASGPRSSPRLTASPAPTCRALQIRPPEMCCPVSAIGPPRRLKKPGLGIGRSLQPPTSAPPGPRSPANGRPFRERFGRPQRRRGGRRR